VSGAGELRVAIVGYGLSGRVFHAPLVSTTAGMAIAAIVTRDPRRRAQAGVDHPAAELLSSAEELWAHPSEIDLVVLCTPTAVHASQATSAIAAGLPVVVEKPLAPSAAEARAVADRAADAGVMLTVFHNRRWDSEFLTLRRLLDDGALGQVMRFESRFERWRPVADPAGWREQPGPGAGVLLDLGVHLVDQALALFGPAASVYAEVEARRAGADDDVFLALEHGGGVRSHLWAGVLSAAPGPRLRVLGRRAAFVARFLDGQEASLRAGTLPGSAGFGGEPEARWGTLHHGDDPGRPPRPVASERGDWPRFYRAVVAALRGDGPPPVPAHDAVSVLEVLDAARRSARHGQIVAVG
jgi:scyllo-inositol 2-dehydrogenase (NADP+)